MSILLLTAMLLVANSAGAVSPETIIREKLVSQHVPMPDSIHLPGKIAIQQSEELVFGRAKTAGKSVWVEVRCRKMAQCRPFYAELYFASTSLSKAAFSLLEIRTSEFLSKKPVAIRAGTATQLVLLRGKVTVRMRAKALQNGYAGESVLVRGTDGKVYVALVRSTGLVEATW